MRVLRLLLSVLLVALVAGCGESAPPESAGTTAGGNEPAFRENPDFGGVREVEVEATGIGGTPEEASLRALDSAISQVNGRRVSSASAASRGALRIDINGLRRLDMQTSAYADLVVSSSDGAVTGFEVVSSEQISKLQAEREYKGSYAAGGWVADAWGEAGAFAEGSHEGKEKVYDNYWKVSIKAKVAKYEAPADDGRPKLLVVFPRQSEARYPVGDASVSAGEVGQAVKRRISQALSQSDRFVMLDRELAPELQREVEFINSGNARVADVARIGQQLATDLIVVPTIERFEYRRHVRKLRMSDRELVSYSGGGAVGLDVINATTGEVVLSRRFEHTLPATDASTMPRVIDGASMAGQMMDALSAQMSQAVLSSIFPISIVALQRDVAVLSQGGQAVKVGDRYAVVRMGEALTDPQTGRSLGRLESPCCTLTVDRVSSQTAYGRIEGDVPDASGFQPGMLELREALPSIQAPTARQDSEAASPRVPAAAAPSPAPRPAVAPAKPPAPSEDPDW